MLNRILKMEITMQKSNISDIHNSNQHTIQQEIGSGCRLAEKVLLKGSKKMLNDIDVIICVGWNDIFVVKKTIKYIRRNIQCDRIFIIINSYYFNIYPKSFLLKYNVYLVDEDQLIPGVTYKKNRDFLKINRPKFSSGWYFQQFLKMAFAQSKYAKDYYLIWDADTLPLSTIQFEKDGKLLFTRKNEFHAEYFRTINDVLGLKKQVNYSFIAEHMLIKSDIMRELISKLSLNSSEPWPFVLLNKINPGANGGFSEYETYGTYVTYYYPDLYESRTLNTWRNAGYVFGRNISDKDIRKLSFDLDIISLECWNGRFFPKNIWSRITELYVKFLRFNYLRKNKM